MSIAVRGENEMVRLDSFKNGDGRDSRERLEKKNRGF
jgi:hypothetical protein